MLVVVVVMRMKKRERRMGELGDLFSLVLYIVKTSKHRFFFFCIFSPPQVEILCFTNIDLNMDGCVCASSVSCAM